MDNLIISLFVFIVILLLVCLICTVFIVEQKTDIKGRALLLAAALTSILFNQTLWMAYNYNKYEFGRKFGQEFMEEPRVSVSVNNEN